MYIVYHGWAFLEEVARFRSRKAAIAYILQQDDPDEYCYEKL